MSFPKLLVIISVVLFGTIFIAAIVKSNKDPSGKQKSSEIAEINLSKEVRTVPQPVQVKPSQPKPAPVAHVAPPPPAEKIKVDPPEANRIEELFAIDGPKVPIVETITYKSRVGWQKGRPAWLSDYANHYQTSRHFIARSLNGEPDYLKQDLAEGDKFNVLKGDKKYQFYLLIDLSRARMWFFYDDFDTKERVLLKTYQVGIGRIDATKKSGYLTPLGKYTLGNKIAIYKPKMMGYYNSEKIEMMTVFGTRWIPFDKELGNTTAPAKGFGIHGTPWHRGKTDIIEDKTSLGKYQSDGCIRLASEDMEELFAIVITKPTVVELVKDYFDAEPTSLTTVVKTVEK